MEIAKIMVCGVTRAEDINVCCTAGVGCIGFITEYPVESTWNLTKEETARLLPLVRHPAKKCLITEGEEEKLLSLAEELRPDFLLVHKIANLEALAKLCTSLQERNVRVIYALSTNRNERKKEFGTEDIEEIVNRISETGIASIMIDPRYAGNMTGRSRTADLTLFNRVRNAAKIPVILGGGIGPESAGRIVDKAAPAYVTTTTGVEVSPGFKSSLRLEELKKALVHLEDQLPYEPKHVERTEEEQKKAEEKAESERRAEESRHELRKDAKPAGNQKHNRKSGSKQTAEHSSRPKKNNRKPQNKTRQKRQSQNKGERKPAGKAQH